MIRWLLGLCALGLASCALAAYDLSWWTVDGGGAMGTTGGGYTLSGTVGQHDAGKLTGGGYTLLGGFWNDGIAGPQPDLALRRAADVAYIGRRVYNTTGDGQTLTTGIPCSATYSYLVTITNDGPAADTFRLRASVPLASWNVQYMSGTTDITATIATASGAGWSTGALASGAAKLIRIDMNPSSALSPGSVCPITITATSAADALKQDVVQITTTDQLTRKPDMSVKLVTDTYNHFENVYSTTGNTETWQGACNNTSTLVYLLRVQNNGNTAESYRVTGDFSMSTWGARYFNAHVGGTNIGSPVMGAGWTTPVLAPGAVQELRLEVTPSATVVGGTRRAILVRAASTVAAAAIDVVKTVTTVNLRYQPDVLLRTQAEAGYTGNDLYNTTATGQTKTQAVAANVAATYLVRVENDGNTADTYAISTSVTSASGWTVQYVDDATGVTITGPSWSIGPLTRGQYAVIRMVLTPTVSAASGSTKSVYLTAISGAIAARKDTVKVSATKQ